MAKRELSTTLKNLKFMQRACQREELAKKEQAAAAEEEEEHKIIPPRGNKKCVVIMEGDPKPGALSGRMSFQNFNPSIDKLNEEAEFNYKDRRSPKNTDDKNGIHIGRVNEASQYGNDGSYKSTENEASGEDFHRKKLKVETDAEPLYPSPRNAVGADTGNQSSTDKREKITQHEREKLDWRLLRPPTGRTKR